MLSRLRAWPYEAPDFRKAVVEDVRNRKDDHCARQCDATDSEYFGSEEVGCDEAY